MKSAPRTGQASLRERCATPISTLRSGWLLTGLLVVALVVPRWGVDRWQSPLESTALPGGGVILVVQPGDCPDRTETLRRWLLTLSPQFSNELHGSPTTSPDLFTHAASLPELHVGVVGRQDLPLPNPLTDALKGIPRLQAADAQAAGRTLTRLAVDGTPALLAVDPRGRPILASDFTPDGRIPGLELALLLGLPGLDPGLRAHPVSLPPETDPLLPSDPR